MGEANQEIVRKSTPLHAGGSKIALSIVERFHPTALRSARCVTRFEPHPFRKGDEAMYARVTFSKASPDQTDQALNIVRESIVPAAR